MPHGTPDWGLIGPKTTTYGLDDLGEHAVRMGSPHLWDRRGDVLLSSDFRNGFGAFETATAGLLGYITLSTGHTRQGAYSALLVSGNNGARRAELGWSCPFPVLGKVGLEYSFSTHVDSEYWQWLIAWVIGAVWGQGWVRHDCVNNRLEYWGADSLWHIFVPALTLRDSDQPENTGKLVVDLAMEQYVRFILNDQTYSLLGIGTFVGGGVGPSILDVTITHSTQAGFNPEVYVDNVIVTQNEP